MVFWFCCWCVTVQGKWSHRRQGRGMPYSGPLRRARRKRRGSLACFMSVQASKAAAIAVDCLWDLLPGHHLWLWIEYCRGHITPVWKRDLFLGTTRLLPFLGKQSKPFVRREGLILTSQLDLLRPSLAVPERTKIWPGRCPRIYINIWSKTE